MILYCRHFVGGAAVPVAAGVPDGVAVAATAPLSVHCDFEAKLQGRTTNGLDLTVQEKTTYLIRLQRIPEFCSLTPLIYFDL